MTTMNADRFDHLFVQPGARPTVHLAVDDLDVRYAQIAPSGTALFAPEATHWGTRWFVVRDPDGNLIAYEEKP